MTEFNVYKPTGTQIQIALKAILASASFADANRLKSFLQYVVEESLNGREANLRAKIIAADVYGRRPEDGVEQEAIVRVDAGRLRRRLDVYYSGEGAGDEVRINVLPGGYVPTFEVLEPTIPEKTAGDPQAIRNGSISRTLFIAAILVFGVGGFGVGWLSNSTSKRASPSVVSEKTSDAVQEQRVIRSSVNQTSSASLLARTFVEEAQELIFPSIDRARLEAAEILCQRAIEIAPELSTGHSCDAITQAYLAFVMPKGDARDTRLVSAKAEAAAALRIDPADAYAQMADAWVRFVVGERKTAIQHARIATSIAPEEGFLRNFYGMMMAFDGQGPELLLSLSPEANTSDESEIYHNFIMAGAYFQAGEYLETIRAIAGAVEDEGRTSALITAIRIAAYEAQGNETAAETYAANFATSWPGRDVEEMLSGLFSEEIDVLAISTRVDNAMARYKGH